MQGVCNHPARVRRGWLMGGGSARGRPWLPRGGATALGGGATELMGDVVIFLLSERQTDKRRQAERKGSEIGRGERVVIEEGRKSETEKRRKSGNVVF